ncbi:RNA polymerase sigma factor [Pedobacter nutrimenti]|jgi:RNA polymerase sigma-70 factor (ECF subfamily)|uniref:RNA polymerase sigma-70 factor (ECF subfamily) n=1 Tax=Pedobacter nutrimenti TaxID=1241337 RepID=A0A318UKS2_9SPHI|nr:RNA polymerase sigma-70 factor [Pedobacter nutrimenti]PYF76992.1 RNA polymerase sigma-70 factor (ECF subfamily) [Pedobacter nutrimenti]
MAIAPLPNESELLRRTSEGDKRAFTVLFDAHYKSLGSYVYKLTESMESAEEIVQEVFIKVWLKKEELTRINNFSAYLFVLCKNKALNHLRQLASQTLRFQAWEKELGSDPQADVEDHYENFRVLIEQAIDHLPEQQQKIYRLSRHERLKYTEIAKELQLSPETVKKHIYLATKTIKEYVKNNMDEMVMLILMSPLIFLKNF